MVKGKKVVVIIQARLSSTRLPAKVMLDLNGKTVLERVIERVRLARLVDEIWLATSDQGSDDILEIMGKQSGIKVCRGSLNNVYERFCKTILVSQADVIVRVTADNPLTEPAFIDEGIEALIKEDLDYVIYEEVPYGTAIEVVRSSVLLDLDKKVPLSNDELEHVTLYIRKHPSKFRIRSMVPEMKLRFPEIRVTLDTIDDYVRLYNIYSYFQNKIEEREILSEIVKYLKFKNGYESTF